MNPDRKHIPELDGMRGVAIASVVASHFAGHLTRAMSVPIILLDRALGTGWLGVDIFFVLSGFLITNIILSQRQSPGFRPRFYLRRAFRILPAATAVISICLLVQSSVAANGQTILFYLLFAANWTICGLFGTKEIPCLGHLWSLAVEEQFYFVWPKLAGRSKAQTVFNVACGIAILSIATRVILGSKGVNAWIIYKITPSRLDCISIGAALAAAIKVPSAMTFLEKHWWHLLASSSCGLLLVFGLLRLSLFQWDVRAQIFAIPLMAVTTAMAIFGACRDSLPKGLKRTFNHRVLLYLGKRSYGLYLVNSPVIYLLDHLISRFKFLPPAGATRYIVGALTASVASLMLAEASWHLLEQPAQKARRNMESRWLLKAERNRSITDHAFLRAD